MDVNIFIKFGEKEHLEKMQKEGLFYCNTITYFSSLEDEHRGDKFESVKKLEYKENTSILLKPANDIKAEWKRLNITKMLYQEYYNEPMGNIFCFSSFILSPTTEVKKYTFDLRFMDLKYGLLILRQDLFMEKLEIALKSLGFKTCMSRVEYLDLNKYSGKKNLFQKDLKYSWQQEHRIILYTNKYKKNDPFIFSIGDISDISELLDFNSPKTIEYKL
jgi:hypothetical protein